MQTELGRERTVTEDAQSQVVMLREQVARANQRIESLEDLGKQKDSHID